MPIHCAKCQRGFGRTVVHTTFVAPLFREHDQTQVLGRYAYVACEKCKAHTADYEDRDQALSAWNRGELRFHA